MTRFNAESNTIRHIRTLEEILWDRAHGEVANIIAHDHTGDVRSMIAGYGRTMKQARSEARMWAARAQRGGLFDKVDY